MIVVYFLTGKQDGENPVKNITLEQTYYPRVGEYVNLDLRSFFPDSDPKTYYGEVLKVVHTVFAGDSEQIQVYLS